MSVLSLFRSGIEGDWLGKAETSERADMIVRLGIGTLCMGELQRLQLEVLDAHTCEMVLAALCIVPFAPAQGPAAGMWSAISGAYTMNLTPDDEGVVALSGTTARGNPVTLTLLRGENDELLLTLLWRVDPAEQHPHRIAAALKRMRPAAPAHARTTRPARKSARRRAR
ncbi:MAG: hypothetical protein IT463_00620 [Planctomycetes bacterium]|nr:hypothetical protein [Planctomycetota bacterium]